MKSLLEVKNMTVDFQGYPAVSSVSFFVNPNEKLGIIGESGSGKSTVAKAVTRLIDVSGGEIILDGGYYTCRREKTQRDI